ncbi:MAG: TPM domain-containing protein [Chitinophagaceae bacterium]|nr:TPM domain-containing protein [Chitinophagaceae bacterium]
MKKSITILFILLAAINTNAQPKTLVQDKENLFTIDEVTRLDSMLQHYRQQTGKLVLIVTDTADISEATYSNQITKQYVPDSTKKVFVFMLLLSRKNQLLFTAVNEPLRPFVTQELLLEIMNAGIPSLKEKRREESALLICKKAMEFLDGLSEK